MPDTEHSLVDVHHDLDHIADQVLDVLIGQRDMNTATLADISTRLSILATRVNRLAYQLAYEEMP